MAHDGDGRTQAFLTSIRMWGGLALGCGVGTFHFIRHLVPMGTVTTSHTAMIVDGREVGENDQKELEGTVEEIPSRPESAGCDGMDAAGANRLREHYKEYFEMPLPEAR